MGKHDHTMEVHLGKFHSEKIEYGICGEKYKCGQCDAKLKLLTDTCLLD